MSDASPKPGRESGWPDEEEEEPLLVDIPSTGIDRDHVIYTVTVSKGDIIWSVQRRFSDFQHLHSKLSSQLEKGTVPKIPPKKIKLGKAKFNEDFVEERRGLLMQYLLKVLMIASPEDVEVLDSFLEYSENYVFGALRSVEHVAEVEHAVGMLRSAAAGMGSLVVGGYELPSRPSFASEEDFRSVSEASSVHSDSEHKSSVPPGMLSGGAKPSLPAALQHMVVTLRELCIKIRSQTEDMAAEIQNKRKVESFLTQRLQARRDEVTEAQQLMADEERRDKEACKVAREELQKLSAQVEVLTANLGDTGVAIEKTDAAAKHHHTKFQQARQRYRELVPLSGSAGTSTAGTGIATDDPSAPAVKGRSDRSGSFTDTISDDDSTVLSTGHPPRSAAAAIASAYRPTTPSDDMASMLPAGYARGRMPRHPVVPPTPPGDGRGQPRGDASTRAAAAPRVPRSPMRSRVAAPSGAQQAPRAATHGGDVVPPPVVDVVGEVEAQVKELERLHKHTTGVIQRLQRVVTSGGGSGDGSAIGEGIRSLARGAADMVVPDAGPTSKLLALCSQLLKENAVLAKQLADRLGVTTSARRRPGHASPSRHGHTTASPGRRTRAHASPGRDHAGNLLASAPASGSQLGQPGGAGRGAGAGASGHTDGRAGASHDRDSGEAGTPVGPGHDSAGPGFLHTSSSSNDRLAATLHF